MSDVSKRTVDCIEQSMGAGQSGCSSILYEPLIKSASDCRVKVTPFPTVRERFVLSSSESLIVVSAEATGLSRDILILFVDCTIRGCPTYCGDGCMDNEKKER